MQKVICPIVELELKLIGRDDAIRDKKSIPNRNRPGKCPFKNLSKQDYLRVLKKAQSVLKNKNELDILMSYFYGFSNEDLFIGATVLEKPKFKCEHKGQFLFQFKICYSLKKEITFSRLKKEIEKIGLHWKWASDTTYKITKFKLIKSPQLKS